MKSAFQSAYRTSMSTSPLDNGISMPGIANPAMLDGTTDHCACCCHIFCVTEFRNVDEKGRTDHVRTYGSTVREQPRLTVSILRRPCRTVGATSSYDAGDDRRGTDYGKEKRRFRCELPDSEHGISRCGETIVSYRSTRSDAPQTIDAARQTVLNGNRLLV